MQFHVRLGTNALEVPVTSLFRLPQALMMEAAAASIMLVPTYQITCFTTLKIDTAGFCKMLDLPNSQYPIA
jgi:hypothetical protein